MSEVAQVRVVSASDSSMSIEFGDGISEPVNRSVYQFIDVVQRSDIAAHIVEMIPAYRTLLVEYDLGSVADAEMRVALSALLADADLPDITGDGVQIDRTIDVPVVYGGEHGPDLLDVANHAGMSEDQVVGIHSGSMYRVFMIGFAPGFPYLGGMDARISCPRLTTPRVRIPAGSVGIAETQTGIYPNASAGGWRIIGRSPTKLFDVDKNPPSLLEPGAGVRFVPVDSAEFDDDANPGHVA